MWNTLLMPKFHLLNGPWECHSCHHENDVQLDDDPKADERELALQWSLAFSAVSDKH